MIGQQRELPRNIEAEAALIGAVLLKNDAFLKASAIVTEEHFFEEMHANIWAVLSALIGKGQVANPILLKTHLGNPEWGEGKTLLGYLTDITMAASSNYATAESYARTVRDTAMMRDLIVIGGQLQDVAYEAPVDMTAEILFAQAESKLEALRPSIQTDDNGFADFDEISTASIYEAYQQQRGVVGLSTGLVRLDDTMNGLQDSDLIVLAGRPGMGKMQSVDAKVYTPTGARMMGDLKVGDRVIGKDGRATSVTGVYPQGRMESYRITFTDGSSTECGLEHLWAVKTEKDRIKKRGWRVASLRTILDTGLLKIRLSGRKSFLWSIPVVEPVEFDPISPPPIPPYTLGVLLGDGSLKSGLVFSTPDQDKDIAERVDAETSPLGFRLTRNDSCACPRYRVAAKIGHANRLYHWIWSKGLAVGSHQKFIPLDYMMGSIGARTDLLRGLMDTDGHTLAGRTTFSTMSISLARNVQELVRSLGGLAKLKVWDRTKHDKGVEYRVNVVTRFCPFACQRKAASWILPCDGKFKKAITSVEPVGMKEQVCIQVSAIDSLYVTDDYVVTHNTALATGISVHVAKELRREAQEGGRGGVVGIFSLEMSSEQLKHRIVSDMASVQGSKLAKGLASAEEMQAFHDAERELRGLPLKIDDRGGLTIAQVKMRARSLHRRQGLRLLVVDYLQLLSGTKGGRDFNRTQEVTEITNGLKALAKELKIPVIALSQLSRDVEKRDDKRPQMADLRESGSIEQDADAILLVFREEYYHRNLKPREDGERLADWARKMDRIRGVAEVNVTKNRHGGDGIVELGWHGEFTRFTNDPPWRVVDPEEARQKARSVALTKHGTAMRDIMKELAVSIGQRPSPKHLAHKAWLPHTALLIVRDEVKEEMRTRVLADLDDKEFRRAMQAAADNLRHAGLTQVYKDEDEVVWIYLVEIIGE